MRGSILHAALQRFYAQLPSALPGAERVTPENVEEAVALMRWCVADAVETGMRIDADDLDRRELEQGLQRDLEQLVRDEAVEPSRRSCPRKLEVLVPRLRARAGRRRQRQDRPGRRRPDERARDRRRLQVRRTRRRPARSSVATSSRSRSTCSCCATSSGWSRWGASTCSWAGSRAPRAAARRRRGRAGVRVAATTSSRRCSTTRSRRRGTRRSTLVERIRDGRRPARPDGRRVPALVRPVADLPQRPRREPRRRTRSRPRRSRPAARVFVAAGAGTGKTTVLVERFARAVVDERPRRRVAARDHLHRAGCGRAALAHPGAARRGRAARPGARPRRRLDLDHPRVLPPAARDPLRSRRASTRASACSARHRRACCRARRSTTRSPTSAPSTRRSAGSCSRPTGRRGCARCSSRVYDTLRSAGRDLVLEPGAPPRPRRRCVDELREAAARAGRRPGRDGAAAARRRTAALELLVDATTLPERLLELDALHGPRPAGRELQRGARGRARRRARGARRPRPRAARRSSSTPSARRTRARRTGSRRSTSRTSSSACATCSRDDPELRARERQRFRSVMVDEFQDTNRLQTELIDLLVGHDGRRHAGRVLRRRRVPVDLRVPARRRRRVPRASRRRRRPCSRSRSTTARDPRCSRS